MLPALVVDLMLLLGIGPAWPSDLLHMEWTVAAFAVVLFGLLLWRSYRSSAFWRFLSGLFFLLYAFFVLSTALSINRMIATGADQERIGDAVGEYYDRTSSGNKKSGDK